MSTNNRDIEINPLSQLYDELRLLLSGLVVKFTSEADKYETFENRKYSDQYLSALNKITLENIDEIYSILPARKHYRYNDILYRLKLAVINPAEINAHNITKTIPREIKR